MAEPLRYHFSRNKRLTQGFSIMDAHKENDGSHSAALFEQLPALLDENTWYSK